MKQLSLFFICSLLGIFACKDANKGVMPCKEITPGAAFEAKVHDTWCLADESVKITVGPILDDSRCNIPGIQCFWAGQTVLELLIETEEIGHAYRDTFRAIYNWQDTISIGSYELKLTQVFPLERSDFVVDTAAYRFQMILE